MCYLGLYELLGLVHGVGSPRSNPRHAVIASAILSRFCLCSWRTPAASTLAVIWLKRSCMTYTKSMQEFIQNWLQGCLEGHSLDKNTFGGQYFNNKSASQNWVGSAVVVTSIGSMPGHLRPWSKSFIYKDPPGVNDFRLNWSRVKNGESEETSLNWNKKLLGAKGIATRSKDATRGSWPYY